MASKFGYTDTLQGIAADSQQKTTSIVFESVR